MNTPKCTILVVITLVLLLISACAFAGPRAELQAVQLRIVCTVATQWDPQRCWVEFGAPVTGQRVEVSSHAEAEDLVAILLENSGRKYEYSDGLIDKRAPNKAGRNGREP